MPIELPQHTRLEAVVSTERGVRAFGMVLDSLPAECVRRTHAAACTWPAR